MDAYYPVCPSKPDATLEQLVECWGPIAQRFRNLTSKFNKTLIVTEIGYCSGNCTRHEQPSEVDMARQALRYEAALKVLQAMPEVEGVFWWSWNTDPGFGGTSDGCISPQGKPS